MKSILKRLYSLILDRCEREAANTYAVEEIPEEAFDTPPPEHEPGSADEAAWLAAHEEAYMFGDPAERSEAFRRYLDENRLKPIRWLLEPILAEFGINAGSDDVEFRRFLREATMFAIRAYEDAARKIAAADPGREINIILDSVRRETRAVVPVNGGRALATSAANAASPAPLPYEDDPDCLLHAPLTECIDGYVKSKAGKKWAPKQAKDADPVFRLLIDFFGDVAASTIRRTAAMRYQEALARVPTQTRIKPFKGKTMQEMTALADEIDEGLRTGDKRYAEYAKRKWVTAGKVDRFSLKNQDKYILVLQREDGQA